ncbi:MAG: SDR family oxidoreductase [Novosphingobium sp.]|nr:SDR family oxidoreductase [Novosphingobium sp.]
MRILLLGASGFIGSEIASAIAAEHQVIGLTRDPDFAQRTQPTVEWRQGELRAMQRPDDWTGLLDGIEAVINASGALQTGLRDDVERVQSGSIRALVAACGEQGLAQFVQVSASNADASSPSLFMATKGEADAFLSASGLPHAILRPGLVIARNAFGGTEMVRMSASLPCIGPEITGGGLVQCVAMADLVEAVVLAIAEPDRTQGSFDLVEQEGRPLSEVIRLHRGWLGLGDPVWRLPVPLTLLRPVSLIADGLGWLGWRSPLRTSAIRALAHGVSGEAEDARTLLGREATSLPATLAMIGAAGKADRWQARTALVFPLALVCLFALWAGSGLLGIVRLHEAAQLIELGGFPPQIARIITFTASVADLAVAALLLIRPTARLALLGMLGLSAAYVVGSLVLVPGMWLDPLGPMLKVLPIIALELMCLGMEAER